MQIRVASFRRSLPVFALVFALAGSGCVTNPLTQQRDVVFLSTEDEIKAGAEAAEQVAAHMGLVDDAATTALVAEVGERVSAVAPTQGYDYSFQIVDRVEPNAFALPGGHIYVSRGLLALTNDEDELANVLAHEIVHVSGRHHAQRQARATGVGLLALPGLLVGGLLGGPLGTIVSAPFAIAGVGAIASYSRGQELESDQFGQRLAAQAGYDPAALAAFLVSLQRDELLRSDEARQPSWFDSHPATPRRVDEARERALALPPSQPRPASRHAYLERIEGLLVGDNPTEGVFDGQRFLHPDMNFTLVFPEGWKTANSRTAVGAFVENGHDQIILELQEGSAVPREAANEFLAELSKQTRVDVARMDALDLRGRNAVRGQLLVATKKGQVAVDATWISHAGSIFRLIGVAPKEYSAEHRRIFGEVGQSFDALSDRQRDSIRETRLRLRQARAGENLTQLSLRTGNRWSLEETAVINGVRAEAPLASGRWIKVAIQEPYRSR
jgi:predicted Zn-dependent protease